MSSSRLVTTVPAATPSRVSHLGGSVSGGCVVSGSDVSASEDALAAARRSASRLDSISALMPSASRETSMRLAFSALIRSICPFRADTLAPKKIAETRRPTPAAPMSPETKWFRFLLLLCLMVTPLPYSTSPAPRYRYRRRRNPCRHRRSDTRYSWPDRAGPPAPHTPAVPPGR